MRAQLLTVPIFAGLNKAALNVLWERATEVKAAAGSVVVSEGNRKSALSDWSGNGPRMQKSRSAQ